MREKFVVETMEDAYHTLQKILAIYEDLDDGTVIYEEWLKVLREDGWLG